VLCTDRKSLGLLVRGAWGGLGGAGAVAPVLQAIQEGALRQSGGHMQWNLQQACTPRLSCKGLSVTELWVVKQHQSQPLTLALGKHTQMMSKKTYVCICCKV